LTERLAVQVMYKMMMSLKVIEVHPIESL